MFHNVLLNISIFKSLYNSEIWHLFFTYLYYTTLSPNQDLKTKIILWQVKQMRSVKAVRGKLALEGSSQGLRTMMPVQSQPPGSRRRE